MSATPGRHQHDRSPEDPDAPPRWRRVGRLRGAPVVAALFLAIVGAAVALATWSQATGRPQTSHRTAALAAADPEVTAVGDAVAAYLDVLDQVSGYQTLKNGMPLGGSGADFLDPRYKNAFAAIEAARGKVKSLAADADTTIQELDAALDTVDGTIGGTSSPVTYDLTVDLTGDVTAASFGANVKLVVKSTGTPALSWLAGGVTVNGRPTSAELGFTAASTVTITPTAAVKFAIKVDGAQTGVLRVGVKGDFPAGATNPLRFKAGVIGVQGVGSVVADIGLKVTLVDPGTGAKDGVIDDRELANPLKLFSLACVSSGANGSLTVKTDLAGLTGDVGTISLADPTLCDGVAAPTVQLARLDDLGDVTVGDVLNGVAQVARSLQAAQAAGDIDLPFVTEGLSNVVQVNERLVKFFVDNKLTDPNHPLDSITFDKDKPPFQTLQELAPKLEAALGLQPGALGLRFDPGTTADPKPAIRFDVHQSGNPGAKVDAGTIDFGDTFGRIGIGAVQGTAKATVTPQYSLDLGLGIATDPGTALADRFFLTNDPKTGAVFTADAAVTAKLALEGAIPPVGVGLSTSGAVPLLQRLDTTQPMLKVALTDPTPSDKRVTLKDLATSVTGAVVPITAKVNAKVPTTAIGATLDVLGTDVASGSLTVGWTDITQPSTLTISADGTFTTKVLPFAFDTSNPKALVVQVLTTARGAIASLRSGIATGKLSTTTPLPVIGKSAAELEPSLVKIQAKLDDLIARADSVSLPSLEKDINRAIADALGIAATKAAPDVLTLDYVAASGSVPARLEATLAVSTCTSGRGLTCTAPASTVSVPFNLPLPTSKTGGIAAVDGSGKLTVGYDASVSVTFGVELPSVSISPTTGQLVVTGTVKPYVSDASRFSIAGSARFAGTLAASFGPFKVSLGKPASGDQAAQNAVAQVAARWSLGGNAAGNRLAPSAFGSWFAAQVAAAKEVSETTAALKPSCSGLTGPYDACAVLPVYFENTFLGNITFTAPDLLVPSGWVPNAKQVEDKLASKSVQFALLVDGVRALSTQLENSLRALPPGTKIPLIGTDVLAGADAVAAFNTNVLGKVQTLSGRLEGLNKVSLVTSTVDSTLSEIGGRTGAVKVVASCRTDAGSVASCNGNETLDKLQSLEVQVPFTLQVKGSTKFDLGFPGLSLKSSSGQLEATGGLEATLAFGVDRDLGFYVPTGLSSSEFRVSADVRLPATMQAELGFVPITVTDLNPVQADGQRTPDVTVAFGLDLKSSRADGRLPLQDLTSVTLTPTVTAKALTKLGLKTQLGPKAKSGMPALSAQFNLDAGVSWTPGTGATTTAKLGFDKVQVDAGQLMTSYIKPVVAEIRKYTSPLEPAIDAIQQPIPGVKEASELAGLTPKTWYELFEEIDEVVNPKGETSGLQLVQRVIAFVETVRKLDEAGSAGGIVDLGSFSLDSDRVKLPVPAADAVSLIPAGGASQPGSMLGSFGTKAGVLQDASTKAGLTFPVLDQPSLLFGMLLGQDVDLAVFDAGKLEVSAGLQFGFPIGPLDLYVGGSATLSGHFRAGFDTFGIRKAFEYSTDNDRTNDSLLDKAAGVLLGLYLDDFDADDNDVPEVTFRAELTAGASIGVPLFKVGAEGGIGGQIDFDLHTEPAQEGKIRYSDIAAQLKKNPNPLCFFDASAKIDAFIRAYLETPLGKSIYPIASGVVWEQENLFTFCQTPVEQHVDVLGSVDDDGVLTLASDDTAQDVVVRQTGDSTVVVEAGGLQETYEGVTAVSADLGAGSDQLDLVRAEGYDGAGLPVRVCGGAGVDRIASDLGTAVLYGDGGEGCDAVSTALAGPDTLTGGRAGDTLWGGPGDDVLIGGDGADTLRGEVGNDVLRGGAGSDDVDGGTQNDTVDYSDHSTKVTVILPGTADDRSGSAGESDKLTGLENVLGSPAGDTISLTAAGSFRVDAGTGDDTVSAGPNAAIVFGGDGEDTLIGSTGVTQFLGGDGDDTLIDGKGAETFLGGPGSDTADYSASTVALSLTVDGRADDGPARNGAPGGSDNLDDVDVVLGGKAADHIVGGPAGEKLVGNGGRDVVEGGGGSDTLLGGADDDTLLGGPDADTLDGEAGNDVLDGGLGPDVMIGGADVDTVDYSSRTQTVWVFKNDQADDGEQAIGERDRVDLTNEKIVGGSGGDWITGTSANETLVGGPGSDRLEGLGGADTLDGGADNDFVYDWSANERFSEIDGQAVDTLLGGVGDDDLYANGGNDVLDGGDGVDELWGGSGDDVLSAGAGSDGTITAGPGNDRLTGGPGWDNLSGGDGVDTIDAGTGGCNVNGGKDQDTVVTATSVGTWCNIDLGDTTGGKQNDLGPNSFTGLGSGRDNVIGGDGPDTVSLGNGGGQVQTLGGVDVITMGNPLTSQVGNLIDAGDGDDTVRGGPYPDTIKGGNGNDHLWGGAGDDRISGNGFSSTAGTDDDDLHGDAGADKLWGDRGDDLLQGGAGPDDLDGDTGRDVVTYVERSEAVTILDDGNSKNGSALDDDAAKTRRDQIDTDVEGITGGSGADTITFGAASFRTTTLYLTGGPGADVITVKPTTTLPTVLDGGAGADTITGGAGPDTMIGGTEDDRFVFLGTPDGADTVVGGAGTADTVDYAKRAKASVVVTFDGVANDGASGEGDNVGKDVEVKVLGAAKVVASGADTPTAAPTSPASGPTGGPSAPADTSSPTGAGAGTGTTAGTPAPSGAPDAAGPASPSGAAPSAAPSARPTTSG